MTAPLAATPFILFYVADVAGAAAFYELALGVARPLVETLHGAWSAKGAPIALAPTQLDFGFGFVALDPDGNRLRVFAPGD